MKTTPATVRCLTAMILSAALTATTFAGLREVSTGGWPTKSTGSLSAAKPQGAALAAPDPGTNCLPGEIFIKLRKNSQAAMELDSVGTKPQAVALVSAGTNELSVLLAKHGATPRGTVFSQAKRDVSGASLKASAEASAGKVPNVSFSPNRMSTARTAARVEISLWRSVPVRNTALAHASLANRGCICWPSRELRNRQLLRN